jgi:hypothetical protein
MPCDLVSRLSETLDELERVAREATDGPWEFDGDAVDVVPSNRSGEYVARYVGDVWGEVKTMLPADARHIARWDPQAVLRLVEAVRELIGRLRSAEEAGSAAAEQGQARLAEAFRVRRAALRDALQILSAGLTEEPSDG